MVSVPVVYTIQKCHNEKHLIMFTKNYRDILFLSGNRTSSILSHLNKCKHSSLKICHRDSDLAKYYLSKKYLMYTLLNISGEKNYKIQ